jgi:predicted HicB family RNase H-like nuclease
MPEPRTQLQLRLPADLHARLTELADKQGVSLNQLLTVLLAGSVSFNLKKPRKQSTKGGTT